MRMMFETAWGIAGVETENNAVIRFFLPGQAPENFADENAPSGLLSRAADEVREYFDGNRREFSVPVAPQGTAFQQAVWLELCKIPFGELCTYGDIARALGKPGASRAIGLACGANPIPLLIPCHRVVGANNKLTGFSGGGIEVKKRMIEHEMGGLFAHHSTRPAGNRALRSPAGKVRVIRS